MASLASRQLYWPFDRRAYPTYLVVFAMALTGSMLLAIRGFQVAPSMWLGFFSWSSLAFVGGMGLRRIGWPNFGGAMEAMGVFYRQGLSAFLCIVPLASLPIPFADPTLSAWDHALGFDWVAWAKMTAGLHDPFVLAYKSFIWQPALVTFALFLSKQHDRGWQTVFAGTMALAISTFVFAFFPAVGASEFYHFTVRTPAPPFHPVLIALKDGSMRYLDGRTFAGMISFPSYHAAGATVLAWGFWKTWLRWPMLAVNILMAVAAISMGSHYLVDILAGLVVAFVSITLSVRTIPVAADATA